MDTHLHILKRRLCEVKRYYFNCDFIYFNECIHKELLEVKQQGGL